MTFSPITSWQIDGEKVETVADFIFWGSKITVNSDYSHVIKRHLLLGRKAITNLESILMEKAMAPHASTLAWKIPWTEEPGRLQSMGSLRVRHDWLTLLHFSLSCIGEGNGHQLQCSCLENPGDRGA